MVDSRQKGARTESAIKKMLIEATGLNWQRVPGSGALDVAHKLKGDLYIPECANVYCVEVKGYKDDHISSKMLTSKNPQIVEWWEQAKSQAVKVDKEPLLIFKFDRSKVFVARLLEPSEEYPYIFYSEGGIYISLLEDWLKDNPIFKYD